MNFMKQYRIYLRNCAVTPEKENYSTAGRMERSREEFETNTKEAATTSGKNPRA